MVQKPGFLFQLSSLSPSHKSDLQQLRVLGNLGLFRYVAWVTLALGGVLLLITSPLVRTHANKFSEVLEAAGIGLIAVSVIFLILLRLFRSWFKASNLPYLVFGVAIVLDAILFAIRDFSLFEDNAAFVLGTMVLGMVLSAPYWYSVLVAVLGVALMCIGVGVLNASLLTTDRILLWLVLALMGALTAMVLETRRRRSFLNEILLREANSNLREISFRDPLTGAYNRRFFQEVYEQQVELASRRGRPLTVMLLDLDKFKSINDRYGHDWGDKVLKNTVELAQAALRGTDLLTRFGGEEFVILLPDTNLESAKVVAERVRASREAHAIVGLDRTVTMSLGVAQFQEGDTPETLLKRADTLLYQAKTLGRNRVCW